MHHLRLLFITILLFKLGILQSQELGHHQWNDRLILILSDDENNPNYLSQIQEFQKDEDGLAERKLIVYHMIPSSFKSGLSNRNWFKTGSQFQKFKKRKGPFEVLLIGLDGGIKLRQTSVLSNENLFALIDSMPMRRNEMRREEKKEMKY